MFLILFSMKLLWFLYIENLVFVIYFVVCILWFDFKIVFYHNSCIVLFRFYLSQVKAVATDLGLVQVHFMTQVSSVFTWPSKPDESWEDVELFQGPPLKLTLNCKHGAVYTKKAILYNSSLLLVLSSVVFVDLFLQNYSNNLNHFEFVFRITLAEVHNFWPSSKFIFKVFWLAFIPPKVFLVVRAQWQWKGKKRSDLVLLSITISLHFIFL